MHIIHFGVNGWRARFDDGFNAEGVSRVAEALGIQWSCESAGAVILIGYDMRHRSREYAKLIGGILASCGLDVRMSREACPIPALGWNVANNEACAGAVMVSGSDAPCEYGGLLVRGSDGGTVSESFASSVDQLIPGEPRFALTASMLPEIDLVGPYLRELSMLVDADAIRAAQLSIVVDSLYGPGQGVFARLLSQLGCKVSEMHACQAEDFKGLHPQACEPWLDECEEEVESRGADLGIALDGDCARCALIDARGRVVAPHALACLLMSHLVEDKGEEGRVVSTLSSSARVTRQAERLKMDISLVPVGFQRIHDELLEGDVLLAAEEYGGVSFPSHLRERDGLLASLYMVEMVAQRHMGLCELVERLEAQVGEMFYARQDVRLDTARVQAIRNMLPGVNPPLVAGMRPVEVSHADGLRLQFSEGAWLMVRLSREDALIRVYAEAPTIEKRDELLSAACRLVAGNEPLLP